VTTDCVFESNGFSKLIPTRALLINFYCFKALIYEFSFFEGASPKIPSLIDSSLEIKKGKF
jgi:hypothetical protein